MSAELAGLTAIVQSYQPWPPLPAKLGVVDRFVKVGVVASALSERSISNSVAPPAARTLFATAAYITWCPLEEAEGATARAILPIPFPKGALVRRDQVAPLSVDRYTPFAVFWANISP